MAKKIKLLYAIEDKYEKDGKTKNKYKKIGVEITEYDASGNPNSYILLDSTINLAGFPNYSKKEKNTHVLVVKFDNAKNDGDEIDFEGAIY